MEPLINEDYINTDFLLEEERNDIDVVDRWCIVTHGSFIEHELRSSFSEEDIIWSIIKSWEKNI